MEQTWSQKYVMDWNISSIFIFNTTAVIPFYNLIFSAMSKLGLKIKFVDQSTGVLSFLCH